jgi:UDP-glucose:(heptosyl)LPS alpha-1,3-glucosyltransferase
LERYTWNLSRELYRQGHEVHIFCTQGEEIPNITLHHVPMFPFSSPGKNLSFAIMASRCITGLGLDVVQSMERIWTQDIFRASDGINPVQMQEKYPNRVVRHLKSMGPRRQVLSLLERRILEKGGARLILTNSNLVKDQILNHYRIPKEKIVVIYNSVDTERFNPARRAACRQVVHSEYGISANDKLILFSGNDFQRKGLLTLLEALVLLKSENIKLIVAGNEQAGRYWKFAAQNGIAKDVFFTGYHSSPELLYCAADLFVLPTHYDAFANVCLEAMACGTPVITSFNNGSAELISDGVEGYVLQTMRAEELSARIRELLSGDIRLMGARAAHKAATFTVDRHIQSLLSLYEKIT